MIVLCIFAWRETINQEFSSPHWPIHEPTYVNEYYWFSCVLVCRTFLVEMDTRPAARVTRGIAVRISNKSIFLMFHLISKKTERSLAYVFPLLQQLLRHDMLFMLLNFEHGSFMFVCNYLFFIDGEQGFIQHSMALIMIIFNEESRSVNQMLLSF